MAASTQPRIIFRSDTDPGQALEWGATAFVASCTEKPVQGDLLQDLSDTLGTELAEGIFTLAALRIVFPDLPDSRMGYAYRKSFLSVLYPDVHLERDATDLLRSAGEQFPGFLIFLKHRQSRMHEPFLLLDNIVREQAPPGPDCLADYLQVPSPRRPGRRLRILYAYSLNSLEPVLAGCLSQDAGVPICYRDFLRFFHLREGTVITDEKEFRQQFGFGNNFESPYCQYSCLEDPAAFHQSEASLHVLKYVSPDSVHLDEEELRLFGQPLPGTDILCRCTRMEENRTWLYRFRDRKQAELEERIWLQKHHGSSRDEILQMRLRFGTVLIESDQEMDPRMIFQALGHRRKVRMLMLQYGSLARLEPDMQEESVRIGTEIVDFLATILSARMLDTLEREGLLKSRTFSEVISILRGVQLLRRPHNVTWRLAELNDEERPLLRSLNLIR